LKRLQIAFGKAAGCRRFLAFFLTLCGVVLAFAQQPETTTPLGPEVSAGGKWTKSEAEEKMTGAKRVRFGLQGDNYLAGSDQHPEVIIYCTGGKLSLGDFRPNIRIGRPNWAGFWGQPQMRVRVRVDNKHDEHNWNWVRGRFLAMDKGTTRELLDSSIFKIEFNSPEGPQIAEFSPAGIDRQMVRQACDLKPKKP
jgi:hypothetical protein